MKHFKSYVLFCILTLLFAFSIPISASEWSDLSGKYVTDFEDNISSNMGNAIAETDDGYIWIGQYSGLTKYNGTKFQTYTQAQDISLNGVISLYAKGNTLYIGTQTTFIVYDSGKFTKYQLDEDDSVEVNDFAMYDNVLYIATNSGLYTFNNGSTNKVLDGRIIDVEIGEIGGFYVVSDNNTKKVYNLKSQKVFYDEKPIKSLYIRNKQLYMGSTDGNVINYSSGAFKTHYIGSASPINTFMYADDLLFIGADNGTYTFDGNVVEKFKKMEVTNSIEAIHMDYQNNLWIVSSSSGINKISSNPFEDLFIKYGISDYLSEKIGISKTGVNGIARYNGLLYFATENCLLCVNEETGQIIDNALVESLMGARIRAITEYDGKLYIGVYSNLHGIVVYDGYSVSSIKADKLVCEGDSITTTAGEIRCFKATDKGLFVGTNYGISKILGGDITTVKPSYRPLSLYYDNDVLYACIDSGNGIETFDSNLNPLGLVPETKGNTILKCLKVGNQLLYGAQNSLCVYNESTGDTRRVQLDISGSIVELLYIDNIYYIGTDSDIYLIEKNNLLDSDLTYLTLGKGEGLRSGLFANASGMYDKDKNIYYFASRNSAYSYNLEFNPKDEIPAKIAVSSIIVDDKEMTIYDAIKLSSKANRITIYIDVLNYMGYDTYSVYYKLEGVDSEFNSGDADTLSSISYTNLKGGKYKLIIYGMDENGVTTKNTITLNIEKELGFFEHTYVLVLFIVFGIIILIATGVITAYFTMKSAKKRQNILKKITLESIEAIARTIDAKDKYTNGHSTRVGIYSRMIAEEMGLPEEEVLNIYYIGLLHDIGKIAVPRSILNKPGRLDDNEFALIKTHTTEGEKILSTISTIPHITEGAKYHHERYDGRGYPEGLSGTNIPFIARIIGCADCFDAMGTRRSYKDPYTAEKIISEFQRCSGTQFDPEIAKVVIKLIEEGKLKPDEN